VFKPSIASRGPVKATGAIRAFACCAVIAAAGVFAPPPAQAEEFAMLTGGGLARLDIHNYKERKFITTVRQEYDFSCGSAAVATLLSYHYERPTSEQDAFTAMWATGNKRRIRQLGFSLLEMKRYLNALNYRADGFKLTLDRIQEIGVPGIALINTNGYRHFVVIKGVTGRKVIYGDPALGITSKSRKAFEKTWDGTILIIRSNVAMGKTHFNASDDWRLAPGGPFARALDDEPLSSVVLHQNRAPFRGTVIGSRDIAPISTGFN